VATVRAMTPRRATEAGQKPSLALPPPRQLLERYGLQPKHSFGQNFLSDPRLLARVADVIVSGLVPGPEVRIVELGAGLGALTSELLARGFFVTAIERDRDLIPVLGDLFQAEIAAGTFRLIEGDAKTVDYKLLFDDCRFPVLAGNLPYQITGPLLEKAITSDLPFERVVFLVQKEVGDRLVAKPGSEQYGALSVFCQARFRPERALILGGGAFYPQPRVESALVRLVPHSTPLALETPMFRSLVSRAFQARRKTLRNAWRGIAAPEELEEAAKQAQISLDLRGEVLGVDVYARMTELLEARGASQDGGGER
jgi:16S rRNA (adenine1518-N6/adenine1519-N6)-dimethyltransferase